MAATRIEWHDYVAVLSGMVPDGLHPAGAVTIWGWIRDMIEAAEHDDAATFARLALLIAGKVDLELEWQAQDREYVHDKDGLVALVSYPA